MEAQLERVSRVLQPLPIPPSKLRLLSSKRQLIDSICKNDDPKGSFMRPHDYSLFLSRLRSFSPAWWFAKPNTISSATCARHGWSCIASSTLACSSCNMHLTHNESDDATGDATAVKLSCAHEETCGWRQHSCPSSFHFLPYQSQFDIIGKVITRILSFAGTPTVLESVSLAVPRELQEQYPALAASLANPARLSPLLQTLTTESEYEQLLPLQEGARHAVLLSLCGWSVAGGELQCDMCGRRLALKSSQSRREVSLLSEHRTFCAWIATEEGAVGSGVHVSGWQRCCDAVQIASGAEEASETLCSVDAEQVYKKACIALDLAAGSNQSSLR